MTAATAPLLSDWIAAHVERPVIIGPDAESEQWVTQVATQLDASSRGAPQRRAGDESISIRLPDLTACVGHHPVLVDDIVASGATMIEAARLLQRAGWPAPVAVAVRGVFAGVQWDRYLTRAQRCPRAVTRGSRQRTDTDTVRAGTWSAPRMP